MKKTMLIQWNRIYIYCMRSCLTFFREPVNAISHMAGALASVAGLTLMVVSAAIRADAWHVVSFAIFGTTLIEKLLSFWSIILYGVFAIMFLVVYFLYGDAIGSSFNQQPSDISWTMGGIKYAAYNIGLVPAILFCVRHIETRKEAIISGLVAGAIGMIPAVFMFFAMLSQYPNVLNASVPVNAVLDKIGWDWFKLIFQILLYFI